MNRKYKLKFFLHMTEQIRRKGEQVRQALEDKEKLVADLLSIPREDYHHIADMAIEEAKSIEITEREPTALVLASVYQGTFV